MSKTSIIATGEKFFITQLSKSQSIKLDRFIFANVPGVNSNTDINVNGKMPPTNQIVHTAPVTQTGLLNDRTVVYSVVLDTNVGDFSFNYIGLVNSDTNTLCMVMHTDLTRKIKTAGQTQGNTITESIWLEIDNASQSTGVTVNAQTWQIDYSRRLSGEDERIRLTNYDLYNRLVILSGFAVTKNNNQLTVSPGLAYVSGLRVENKTQKTITVANNQSLFIDAWLTGTVTGEWAVSYNIIAGTNLKDYAQSLVQHYVERLASVDASGKLTTVKTKRYLTSDDLSSKTDSTNENVGANSLAVKRAYDLAASAVKKTGDTMSGQLILPKEGLKVKFDSGDIMATISSDDNYSHVFYNSETKQWLSKLVYNSSSNSWRFQYVNDVTINNKSVLKTGDYGIGSLTGAPTSTPNERLLSGWYAVRTSDFPDLPRNDSATLIVYGTGNPHFHVQQVAAVASTTARFFNRCRTINGNQAWNETITTSNIHNFIPVGVPLPWPKNAPPSGWLECNGSAFDTNKFPALANAYPSGTLPDLRGVFIRGKDNNRGLDPNRSILSYQDDAIRNIWGRLSVVGRGAGAGPIEGEGAIQADSRWNAAVKGGDRDDWGRIFSFNASRVVPVAHENRPRNVAFMYIVKAE